MDRILERGAILRAGPVLLRDAEGGPSLGESGPPRFVHGGEAAVEADHQDAAGLGGEVGQRLRFHCGGRKWLFTEDVDACTQSQPCGVEVLGSGGEHEDRVKIFVRDHRFDRRKRFAETPATHERLRILLPSDHRAKLDVVACHQGGQLRNRGDISRTDDADAGSQAAHCFAEISDRRPRM